MPRRLPAEGYRALFCLVPVILVPFVLPLPEPLGLCVGILYWVCWACGWLFAISGVRRDRGGAQDAAFVSLAVLVLHAGLLVLVAWR